MKKILLATVSASIIAGATFLATAEDHPDGNQMMMRKDGGERAGKMMKKMDADNDGSVSRDEYMDRKGDKDSQMHQPKRKGLIEAMDKNNDGAVSEDEFMAGQKKHFADMDTNKDGKISEEELKERREKFKEKREEKRGERFDKMDKDSDGSVSMDEMKARSKERMEKKMERKEGNAPAAGSSDGGGE